MKLYDYFRSSAAFRVRIALNLKGLAYESVPVNLLKDEQTGEAYRRVNPQARVPSLEVAPGVALAQSLAIIEYLDESNPEPALLPADPIARARVRAMALTIACDVHPLNNSQVQKYLRQELGCDDAAISAWIARWIGRGFSALEILVAEQGSDTFCFGREVSIADLCLVPQVWNARRFGVDLSAFPRLVAIDAALMERKAFRDAAPENQPDAV